MALKVAKCEVWAVTIDDRPGGAAEKLETLSKAGANLIVTRNPVETKAKSSDSTSPSSPRDRGRNTAKA